MKALLASTKATRDNFVWFALGYVVLVVAHYVMVYKGSIPEGSVADIASGPLTYSVAVAISGYAFVKTQGGWSEKERHSLSLGYTLISFGIDLVAILFVLPPLSPAFHGLFDLPGLVVAMVVLLGLAVSAAAVLISLAIWYAIARLILYCVKNLPISPTQGSTNDA